MAYEIDGVRYEEEFILNSRGMKLFTCRWLPANHEPKALIFLCHGYAMECSISMKGAGTRLAKAGFGVYGMDYEGHGKSSGLQGYVPCFEDLVTDCSDHYTSIAERKENMKKLRILLGESMGGAVALLLHRKKPASWDGAVLVAPMCKIADDLRPNPLVIKVLTKLCRVIPTWKIIPTQDIVDVAFRDPEVRKEIRSNSYCYTDKPRLQTGNQLMAVSLDLEQRLNEVSLPFLVVHGGDDKVTDPAVSKLLCKSAKCKSTKVSLQEFDNQVDAQISTDEMPAVIPRRSTRIRGAPKFLISGDFVGPWQRLSNENKRGLRDVESEDSSIECDCVDLCLCGNLGTPRLQLNVEMQASTEQSSKQHQTPNAWNTPTRVLTDLEQWPKLAIVSPLPANEMIMTNKLGSPSGDQMREVIGTKQQKSVENVRACRNEDLVELHMEDTQSGKGVCLDGDTTAISGKPLQAWSSLLKEEINKVSKMKYKIGAHKIENLVDGMYNVPIEISKKGFSHWENALVGYFIDKRFSFHYVKTWAEKLWGNLLEDVVSIDNGFFIFKVKSEEAIDKILEDGPYYVGARLIVVKKWQPGLKLTKCEFSSVPLWVKLYNVPLELWTEEGLGYIASIMGTPLYLDEPTFKRSRLTFARICIEVPANKEIPKSFKINLGYGDPYEIQVEVPWKPQRCDACKTFGHTTNLCPQKPKTLNPPSSKQEWRVKETNIQVQTKWEVVKKKGRDDGQGSTTVINKEGETQCFTPPTSNPFDVLESCDMGELGNEELNQDQTKSLKSRGSPSPSDPLNGETTKEDNRRKLKAKLHYLKSARGKF